MKLQRPLLTVLLLALIPVARGAETFTDPWANVSTPDLSSLGTSVGELDRPPKVVKQTPAKYPEYLKLSGVSGSVNIGFIVGPDGHVENLRVINSTTPEFERPAIDAVAGWLFEPGIRGGKTVATNMSVMMNFRLSPTAATQSPATKAPSSLVNPAGGKGSGPIAAPTLPPPAPTPTYVWEIVPPKSFPANFPENFKFTEPPQPVRTAFPVYPFAQLAAGTKGKVNVGVVINPLGRISEVNLIGPPPPREFEMAVRAMLDTWIFRPARRDGQPCYCAATFSIDFTPAGTSTVPVSEDARRILAETKKKTPKVVPLETLDHLPAPYSRPQPRYPLLPAGMTPTGGSAVVEFYIDEQGDAQLAHVVTADNEILGAAAVQAVAAWRFEAPKKDKKAVIALARTVVQFTPPLPAPAAPPRQP